MFDELLSSTAAALRVVDTYRLFPENRLARAISVRLHPSRRTVQFGSITLLHGAAGVGKTHLAAWTLSELKRRHPELSVVMTSTQRLTESLQIAEQRQQTAEFLERCRGLDVMVCEDLDWLAANPATQPQLMMLIDALEESSTRILFTARKPVGELRLLDQRLVSRCLGGLSVPLPKLETESRTLLLQHWFQELKLPILKPMSASARLLAERLPVTPHELREAVLQLADLQAREPSPIDVAYLERWLRTSNGGPQLSFEAILRKVAVEFGVDPLELRSKSRLQSLAVPRQCAMWLARELTGRPLDQIGTFFDRSHTTVSHSLARLRQLLPKAPQLRHQVQKLRQQLKDLPREDCA